MKKLLFPLMLILLAGFMNSCSPGFFSKKHGGRQWVKKEVNSVDKPSTAQSYQTPDSPIDYSGRFEETVSRQEPEAEGSVAKKETKTKANKVTGATKENHSSKDLAQWKLKKSRERIKKDITANSTTWLAYGITSFVLGFMAAIFIILAIVTKFFIIFAIIGMAFSILAVIFGILGLKGKRMRWLTILGLIMGGLAFIGFIVLIIMFVTGSL